MSFLYRTYMTRDAVNARWLVFIQNRFTRQIVTCGVFYFKMSGRRWAKDTIARRAWRDASELPDDFDMGVN